jgi:16S rRNA (cytosine1402-N4)-methyltransferase
MNNENQYHIPVLLEESLKGLALKPNGVYLDATLGGGGHFRVIATRLDKSGIALGIDRDADAVVWNKEHVPSTNATVILQQSKFSEFDTVCAEHNIKRLDGILLDLGVSRHQIGNPDRGFTYMTSSPLDMRMDSAHGQTAAELIAQTDAEDLAVILADFGEVRHPLRMAQTIKKYAAHNVLETSDDLKRCLHEEYGPNLPIHVLAKVFQALRIAVNGELEELSQCLEKAARFLNIDGRLVVISYHSLEDRIVKNFIRDRELKKSSVLTDGKTFFERITKKPLCATDAEVSANRSARSAKLRVARRVA